MILIDLGQFTISSQSDGTEVSIALPVQDWGFQVKDLWFGARIVARSSTDAKIHLSVKDMINSDTDSSVGSGTDVIASSAVGGTMPVSRSAALADYAYPFFRPILGVASNEAQVDTLTIHLYAGGKPA